MAPLTLVEGGPMDSSTRRLHLLAPDLGHLFERIVRTWGADHVQHLGSVFPPQADLPMERMALLTGTLRGILVLRSSKDFPSWLQQQRAGSMPMDYSAAETFEELLSFFSVYLYHDFWVPESFSMGRVHPFPSIPLDWPKEPLTASCGLIVEGFKVEIRLWKTD